jgi:hypothetical protein
LDFVLYFHLQTNLICELEISCKTQLLIFQNQGKLSFEAITRARINFKKIGGNNPNEATLCHVLNLISSKPHIRFNQDIKKTRAELLKKINGQNQNN